MSEPRNLQAHEGLIQLLQNRKARLARTPDRGALALEYRVDLQDLIHQAAKISYSRGSESWDLLCQWARELKRQTPATRGRMASIYRAQKGGKP